MASRNHSPHTSTKAVPAFTLIEILVVVGLLVVIGAFTAAIGYDSYRVGALHGEEHTLTSVLQKARAEALNNIGQSPHGVAIFPTTHPSSYVAFEGADYASADHALDEIIDSTYPVTIATPPAEVVFEQLSGESNYSGVITITDPVRGISATIFLNSEGRISK